MDDRREDWRDAPHKRNPVRDLWRLGEINRWQIVRTTKSQNVAEHSFMVTLLALRIAEATGEDRGAVMQAALLHDAEEAWTGDIASPAKQFINNGDIPVREMMGDMSYLLHIEGVDSVTTSMIVKVADLATDIKFLMCYGDGPHAEQVLESLRVRLANYIGLGRDTAPRFKWGCVELELDEFWHGDETHLDDYITKTA